LFNDALNATYQQFASAPIDTQQAASGKVLYEQNCLACHGETGYGNGPAAAGLKTKPFDLTVHALQHDESYFIAVLTDGRGEMPAFKGKLTTQEMLNLVQYMRQLARDAQAEK
jgi:mono/diheme cytochrome c family protein